MIVHRFLEAIIPYITSTLELVGVLIIAIAGVRAVKSFLFNKFNFSDDRIGVNFAQALSLSLEFKLGAEIIKTVVIRNLDEFMILAAVALLRVILTVVLHWELKSGAKDICDDPEIGKVNKKLF